MNLTDFEQTPVHAVFAAVRNLASQRGVSVASSEIIGLIPRSALGHPHGWLPTVENFDERLVLETRL